MPEVPGYQMERRLGAGGMGVVLLARAQDSGARRVIKVLAGSASAESRTRFEREARLLASIRHENIVAIHAVAETLEGRPCLILSHVEGETLHDLRRREGRLEGDRVAALFESLASATVAVPGAVPGAVGCGGGERDGRGEGGGGGVDGGGGGGDGGSGGRWQWSPRKPVPVQLHV